ncbi:MAG: hypothetical protein PWP15_951 [Methanothermococcus sp.]|uniref:pentapeptide repeat-containing protein n=1 Tax=Methanothermococcus sp. TaxID=2614238 RepID=UPI00258553E3|nr:pentapeptide repeat-containing protein [Methanothermococcus sp.]MDK2790444.1 hypothetical protein [Methanothermococcus sp.]MDK2987763.1 hypothetical protein [Methanothermococcus sp.]
MENVKIIYNDKNKKDEDFYEEFINALKSEEKVFNLNDCVIDGSVSIVDIYNKIIKEEENLKNRLIKEKNGDICIDIDIKIDFTNVEFKGHVNFYTGAYSKRTIPGYNYNGKLTFSKPFIFVNCKVVGDFKAMNCKFESEANFSSSIFVRDADFRNSEFHEMVRFNNTVFSEYMKDYDGSSNFKNVDFSGVTFKHLCFFDEAELYGKAEFSGLLFKSENDEVGFKYSNFSHGVSFKKVKFFGEVHFGSYFSNNNSINAIENVSFEESEFHGKTSFYNSEFDAQAYFEKCKFKGETYFQSMVFKNIVSFDKSVFDNHTEFACSFESIISFKETEFNHSVNFISTKFSSSDEKIKSLFSKNFNEEDLNNTAYTNFIGTKFNNASFIYSNFNTGVLFRGVEFKNVDFYGTKFKSVSFEFCICDGDFVFSNEYPNIKTEDMETVFKGDVYIKSCSFNYIVIFDGIRFEKNVEVIGCEFKRKFKLTNSYVIGNITIQSSEFNNILLSDSEFMEYVNFIDLYFEKYAKFSNLTFEKSTKFSETIFKLVEFLDISFKMAVFSEIIFEDIISFKNKNNECNAGILIFNSVSFKNSATFFNIPLSRTSFLLTDTKNATIITNNNDNRTIITNNNDNRTLDDLLLKLVKEDMSEIKENYHKIKKLERELKLIKENKEKIIEIMENNEIKTLTYSIEKVNEEIKKVNEEINELKYSIKNNKEKIKDSIEYDKEVKKLKELENELKEKRKESEKLINRMKPKIKNIINCEDDEAHTLFLEIFIETLLPYLREETVVKEYRDIRMSFENNRTYVEASELFIYEMDLIRESTMPHYEKFRNYMINQDIPIISMCLIMLSIVGLLLGAYPLIIFVLFLTIVITSIILYNARNNILKYLKHSKEILEGIAFDIYKTTSNYGESMAKPLVISLIFVLFAFPILLPNINLEVIIKPIGLSIYNGAPEPLKTTILHYDELLGQTLRAFFQLGIDNNIINSTNSTIQKEQLKTLASYEWAIRVISLILIGSILIAIKRRLERR